MKRAAFSLKPDVVALLYIFIGVMFLGRFGVSSSIIYPAFLVYSLLFIAVVFLKKSGTCIYNRYMFISLVLVVVYVVLVYFYMKLDGAADDVVWRNESVMAYVSVVLVQIMVLLAPDHRIFYAFKTIKYFSYFIVLESFFYLVLPSGFNIFMSDMESGYRFSSFFLNSYLLTGLFLISGYVVHFFYNNDRGTMERMVVFLLFLFAILQTKDRSMILSFVMLNLLLFFKIYFYKKDRTRVVSKVSLGVILCFVLILPYYYLTNISDRDNVTSIKSTLMRVVLVYRSYEIFEYMLPFGGGPGSQVRLMIDSKVPTSSLNSDFGMLDDVFGEELHKEKLGLVAHFDTNRGISTHNTYMDHLVSLGIVGGFMVLSIVFLQLKALFQLLKRGNEEYSSLNAFFVSSIVIFSFTSFINILWFFVLMYRGYSIRTVEA